MGMCRKIEEGFDRLEGFDKRWNEKNNFKLFLMRFFFDEFFKNKNDNDNEKIFP